MWSLLSAQYATATSTNGTTSDMTFSNFAREAFAGILFSVQSKSNVRQLAEKEKQKHE
jgi:hypothetical protein